MRSVHFLQYPEPRPELKDVVVERRISRMRSVIELVRQSRERRTVSLRTPLKTLVVIHNDQQYLDDIKSLQGYITEELNVRDLVLSSDESKYNVQYGVTLNFQKVGKKLRGDAKKVQKALLELGSSECKGYLSTGKINVAGVDLEEGDIIVKRGLPQDKASETQETNGDNEVLTILDVTVYPELAQEGLAREIIARVQQLRKKAGLKTTDDVKMEYRVKSDPQNVGLQACFEQQSAFIEKTLRRPVDKHVVTELEPVQNGVKEDVIAEEDQEVQDATFLLRLVRL
jgi:isoleucyl-tRNA synthetase